MQWLRDRLVEPAVRSLDVDSLEFEVAHRAVLQSKLLLRDLFAGFYDECNRMDKFYFGDVPGQRVEIGSGSSFMKQVFPDVITSDIKRLPFVDAVLRAEQMPFPTGSLRAIYAINVFHHLPSPRAFFKELLRVLHPGGGIVLIEPYYGFLASHLFRDLHASEGFDPNVPAWESENYTGPSSNANQALSYVVFKRDRAIFEHEFPQLILLQDKPHTQLMYFLSGGVNFRQLVPNSFAQLVKYAERIISPLNTWVALQHTLVLRKQA